MIIIIIYLFLFLFYFIYLFSQFTFGNNNNNNNKKLRPFLFLGTWWNLSWWCSNKPMSLNSTSEFWVKCFMFLHRFRLETDETNQTRRGWQTTNLRALKQKFFMNSPGWPFPSWSPFCLWSTLRGACLQTTESLRCAGATGRSDSQRRGCKRGTAWSELWSCWCNLWLRTGRAPRLKCTRRLQGAGGQHHKHTAAAAATLSEVVIQTHHRRRSLL